MEITLSGTSGKSKKGNLFSKEDFKFSRRGWEWSSTNCIQFKSRSINPPSLNPNQWAYFVSENLIQPVHGRRMSPIRVMDGCECYVFFGALAGSVHHVSRVQRVDEVWRKCGSLLHFIHWELRFQWRIRSESLETQGILLGLCLESHGFFG